MITKQQTDPRAKSLDSIVKRIATFALTETYTDEPEVQGYLAKAIEAIREAQSHLKGGAQ